MGILLALILFGFIVFFHELGHFLLAKVNGIEVSEFAIGMGPNLLAKEHKGTVYSLKLLPIGGMCVMGEDEEATDSPGNFNNKSPWARMAVIAAGPGFNFILAFLFAVILVLIAGYDPAVVSEVEEGYPAYEAGIEEGDVIRKINGESVRLFREISSFNQMHQGESAEVTYMRDGEEHTVTLKPLYDEELQYYRYGIIGAGNVRGGLSEGLFYGAYEVKYWIGVTVDSLRMLLTGQVGIGELSGPIGIVSVVDDSYQETKAYGFQTVLAQMLYMAILLSANLGVMNLLPFPALDGGRLLFLIAEVIRGKRVPPEKEGMVHFAGIVLLMVLMLFVCFQDIRNLLVK